MHVEDLDAADPVRPVNEDLPVEAAGAQKGRIENLRPVRRPEQDEAGGRIESVHLDEELVQGLLLLVVAAGERADATGPAEGIQLIDEDDGRGLCTRLLEEVPHPRCADAHEHLDEFGAGDGEEGDAGLAGHRFGEKRLARAGGTYEQDALRHAAAKPAVFAGILQEGDDLLQLFLCLVNARHILEADAGIMLDIDFRLAPADLHQPAAEASAHAPEQEHPDADEERDGDHPGEDVADQPALDLAGIAHAVALQLLGDLRIDAGGNELRLAAGKGLLEAPLHELVRDGHLGDPALAQILLEFAIGDGRDLLAGRIEILENKEADKGSDPVPDVELRLLGHASSPWRASPSLRPI